MDKKTPILVVDDYRTMLRIVSNLLRQIGFEQVELASDGGSALDALREKRFGLIIADLNMQPMCGLELLREVRAAPSLRELPFILIAPGERSEKLLAAREAGATDCIIKPFNAATLQIKIESALCA